MGACPVRVISFENYSIDTVNQQIKNVDMPDEFDEKPRILALACENDAYPALDMAAQAGEELSQWARVIPVRCLGSVSLSWVTDALNSGFDGIVLMGCRRDMELLGGHGVNDLSGFQKAIAKARELEEARIAQYGSSQGG